MPYNLPYVDLSGYQRQIDYNNSHPVDLLNSLLGGAQQGLDLQQLPQKLQDQQLARQLNNALIQEKLYNLQHPDEATARKLQLIMGQQYAHAAATPGSGYNAALPGMQGITIAQPNAITAEQEAGLPTQEMMDQQKAMQAAGVAVPSLSIPQVAPSPSEVPVFNAGKVGINFNPLNEVLKPSQSSEVAIGMSPDGKSVITQNRQSGAISNRPIPGSENVTNGPSIIPLPGKGGAGGLRGLTANARLEAIKYQGKYGIPLDPNIPISPEEQAVYNAALQEKDAIAQKREDKDLASLSKQTEVLAKDVQNNKAYQAYRTVSDAVDGLNSTLEYAKSNPANQTGIKSSAVDAFNRIINPNSVVRQQAFAQTTQGQSLLSKFDNFVNGLNSGQTITPEQIQSMVDLASEYESRSRDSAQMELDLIKKRGDKAHIDSGEYLPSLDRKSADGMVDVINPDGIPGRIPTSKLPAAIKAGFKKK